MVVKWLLQLRAASDEASERKRTPKGRKRSVVLSNRESWTATDKNCPTVIYPSLKQSTPWVTVLISIVLMACSLYRTSYGGNTSCLKKKKISILDSSVHGTYYIGRTVLRSVTRADPVSCSSNIQQLPTIDARGTQMSTACWRVAEPHQSTGCPKANLLPCARLSWDFLSLLDWLHLGNCAYHVLRLWIRSR